MTGDSHEFKSDLQYDCWTMSTLDNYHVWALPMWCVHDWLHLHRVLNTVHYTNRSSSSDANIHQYTGPWASCQIRKTEGCACAGNAGTFSPPPWISDPDMNHGTCVTRVPWCMSGSLTSGFLWRRWRKKNVPRILGACATRNYTYLARDPSLAQLMDCRLSGARSSFESILAY